MSSYLKLNSSLDTNVSVANADFPSISVAAYSIAIWCRFSSTFVSKTLFHNYTGGHGFFANFNKEDSGDLLLEFFNQSAGGSVTARIENVPIKLNEWQLFVFIRDSITNQSIYIDAVLHSDTLAAGPSSGGPVSDTSVFYLGHDPLNPSTSSSGNIDIDGFAFYGNTVLSESDIRDIYNKGFGHKLLSTTPNLDFGFNFDEGTGTSLTDVIADSAVGTINSNASPFNDVWGAIGGVDTMHPFYIKMYLTSLEPDLEQTNYSQSIGGYISESLLYPETTLATSSPLGLYETTATITDATDLLGDTHIVMLTEIAEVEAIDSTTVTITERGVNDTVGYYPSGTIVQGIVQPFNDSFNTDRKQYRCYAVKNTSETEIANFVSVYLKQLSRNSNTTIRLALEYPKSQEITGVSTSWTSSMLIDSSLAGTYDDNLFTDSYMTFEDAPNAGERRRINSYDGATGTFVFADSLPIDFDPLVYSSIINYIVDASPAQRVNTGTVMPANTDYISDFSTALSRLDPISLLELDGLGRLLPEDIIYIWVEREIGKSNSSYDDNSFVLSIDFEKEIESN